MNDVMLNIFIFYSGLVDVGCTVAHQFGSPRSRNSQYFCLFLLKNVPFIMADGKRVFHSH